MCPEYGATVGFFPVDDETLSYMRFTGRPESLVTLVEAYAKEQQLFRTDATPDPVYSEVLDLDLGTIEPSLAGPKRPQDRIALSAVPASARATIEEALAAGASRDAVHVEDGGAYDLENGHVVIAAITSCTNTSNPEVMVGAGLLARNAVARGMKTKPWVKTSLAPGSKVVTDYLNDAGLTDDLDALGFNLVGYGCTTCIGNSGPLPEQQEEAIVKNNLTVAAVLSGNRNFEARVHNNVRANYLASPPLVVAYALAGRMDIDLANEPVGEDAAGKPVYLREIWPSQKEVIDTIQASVRKEMFTREYADVFAGDDRWRALQAPTGERFAWDEKSTYIRRPPFFERLPRVPAPLGDLKEARVLGVFGDSITTDHISPAGNIAANSPAARYLEGNEVSRANFNTYGARRGNHEVMMRGTFANVRLRNRLLDREGALSVHLPDGEEMPIWDAAEKYQSEGVPLIILAGREYGSGSSRDWAAKGPMLQGVKAVIAQSFERIHRSNLVGMGIIPLEFTDGASAESLGLSGRERYDIEGIAAGLAPRQTFRVHAIAEDGSEKTFSVRSRIDTPVEVEYIKHGGILQYVLRELLES
jgi:aconitate hydratase